MMMKNDNVAYHHDDMMTVSYNDNDNVGID